jgi:hypothetical protein
MNAPFGAVPSAVASASEAIQLTGEVVGVLPSAVQFGQIYPAPAGDLKQPTDSGITCLGSHSTTFGK